MLIFLFTASLARNASAQDVAVFPQLGHTQKIESIAFSPDGRMIVSGGSGNALKLWDAATGRLIRSFWGHTREGIRCAAFSPDGRYIISGADDRTVRMWDTATGRETRTFSGHESFVTSAVFSPDGRQVLSASGDQTVKLWDAATGREVKTFSGHTDTVTSAVFSPDGKYIISGSHDKTIKLFDAATGRLIRTISAHSDSRLSRLYNGVRSVAFSPDGTQILSGSGGNTFKLWDAATGRLIRTFSGHRGYVQFAAFSPDGKRIVSSAEYPDYDIKLWDADTGRVMRTFSENTFRSVMFSPDGRQILSVFYDRENNSAKSFRLYDAATGREIRTFSDHTSMVSVTAFSPDGKRFLTGSRDHVVNMWDAVTGRKLRTFSGHTREIVSVAFSPDASRVLSASRDNIKMWDAQTGREIASFSGENIFSWKHSFYTAKISPDGSQILSAGDSDGTITLWDAAEGRKIRTFLGHTNYVRSVAFSPDGGQVLSGSWDNTVKLWDTATGTEIRTFSRDEEFDFWCTVYTVDFSPDGRQILSSYRDRTIILWDAQTGNEIRRFSKNENSIISAFFSPDGKHVLSGLFDGAIKLWDAQTGSEIKTFSGHISSVESVSFSPDGGQMLSSSWDGTVRLWDVAGGNEIAQFISFSGNDSQLAAASRGLTVETETAASSIDSEWLSITPDGYYTASPRGDRYVNIRTGNAVSGIDSYRSVFYNPDMVQARLCGLPDPASKANFTIRQAASFTPPAVTIQSPENFTTTNTATTNLSVVIASQSQPVRNIKILVNGRLVGREELASVTGTGLQTERASLTVTGNQRTVNFNLPLELEPGDNRIEVVAFNGYSENRAFVDVTRNAPAERPPLPNLWVVAVGVNSYENSGPRLGGLASLNFAVADAKGLVQSLKAQEGRRYAKVNAMLIADGERLAPTAENIRLSFKFLEGADVRRDVVVLFLAGHGISSQSGQFFFLPKDAVMGADKIVDESRAISGDEIITVLDAPGNRLVFIDACNSGGVDNDRMVRSLMDTNAFVFTASRGSEFSYESKELGHGFFTHSIMTALGGAPAALAQGNVSVLSMSGFVKEDVPMRTGGRQNPSAYSLGFYDFPVALINAQR